jgi:hypothetical protein
LVLTIEQSFGVKFSEDDLVQATTIGALSHNIFVKLEPPVSPKCLSAITYYKFRAAFVELFGTARGVVSHGLIAQIDSMEKPQETVAQNPSPSGLRSAAIDVAPMARCALASAYGLGALLLVRLANIQDARCGVSAGRHYRPHFNFVAHGCDLEPARPKFPSKLRDVWPPCETRIGTQLRKDSGTTRHFIGKRVTELVLRLIAAEIALDVEKISGDTYFPEGLRIY